MNDTTNRLARLEENINWIRSHLENDCPACLAEWHNLETRIRSNERGLYRIIIAAPAFGAACAAVGRLIP